MQISHDKKTNCFLLSTAFGSGDLALVQAMPERRFRKAQCDWSAPALMRNVRHMAKHMGDRSLYTDEAWQVYSEIKKKIDDADAFNTEPLPSWYRFKEPPLQHQRAALDKFYGRDVAALLFEQGLGKTYTAINLACAWNLNGEIEGMLVLCPSSIRLVWEHELEKHSPIPVDVHVHAAGKNAAADKFSASPSPFACLVMGIESLSQGSGVNIAKNFLLSRKCAIVVDESSRIKNPTSLRTDRCIELADFSRKRVILSGTSVTQGIEDWYSQFRFLDGNILGFDSFYSFRDYFCTTATIEVSRNRFVSKIVGYQNEAELAELVAPHAMRVEKKDALDLPDKVFTVRHVEPTKAQWKLYNEMREFMAVDIDTDDAYLVENALEQRLRLMQITGGFKPHDDGETVQAVPIDGKNPKVEAVVEIAEELNGKKFVVWCQFHAEVQAVADALATAGVQAVQFHGKMSDEEKRASDRAFKEDPRVQAMIATRAAAYGLTWTAASYAVYFSQSYSLEEYSQSLDRIHRIGQANKCTYIHLAIANTIDVDVARALANKQNIATMAYESIKARG